VCARSARTARHPRVRLLGWAESCGNWDIWPYDLPGCRARSAGGRTNCKRSGWAWAFLDSFVRFGPFLGRRYTKSFSGRTEVSIAVAGTIHQSITGEHIRIKTAPAEKFPGSIMIRA